MKDKYSLFGLNENCTDEELEREYRERRSVYAEDRFLEGEDGNRAAKKLTELDMAYRDIMSERREKTNYFSNSGSNSYAKVEDCIKNGDYYEAQRELDQFNDRNAEWHYLQAVVFFKKNWHNESKKQLEIAMQMDPSNEKYRNSYNKLEEKIKAENDRNFSSYNGPTYSNASPQMGGDGCCQWCCEMAICNMMLNCFCNSCG